MPIIIGCFDVSNGSMLQLQQGNITALHTASTVPDPTGIRMGRTLGDIDLPGTHLSILGRYMSKSCNIDCPMQPISQKDGGMGVRERSKHDHTLALISPPLV